MAGNGGARPGAGRPKGSKSLEYQALLASKAPAALDKLVELATGDEPNMQALKLLIDRTVAPLRPESLPVKFDLIGDSPSEQAQSIVKATSEGKLSPTVAVELLNAVSSCMKILEVTDLIERIETLEKTKQ